ncbi:hypothetical protein AAFC00_000775 [Neodothiora populina]|uniref:S-adenosyl-L-methionine-dependent methyltransferase n=1 Tax=Neodothiora populina TaxID=2781224 RepID=A0ABR3PLR3_9PEZI
MSEDPTQTAQPKDARERLKATFVDRDPSTHPERWDALWQKKDTPWDQGTPNPALVDFLREPKDLIPTPVAAEGGTTTRRRKALVPGCGAGYDVLLFASFGYDAYGVEGSRTAIEAAEQAKANHESRPEYAVADSKVGCGEARFLYGNFFEDDWLDEIEGSEKEGFDVIYDYTFLCALPPAIRPKWAQRMSRLLSPTGRLVCLEFPTYKAPSLGGPPWAVRPAFYVALLSRPGEAIEYDDGGNLKNGYEYDEQVGLVKRTEREAGVEVVEGVERTEKGLLRVAHWRPERTHEIGKETDWISVWRH